MDTGGYVKEHSHDDRAVEIPHVDICGRTVITEICGLGLHDRNILRDACHNKFDLVRGRHCGILHDRVVSSEGLNHGSCDHQCGHVRAVADLYFDVLVFPVDQKEDLDVVIKDLLLSFFLRSAVDKFYDRVVITHVAGLNGLGISQIRKYCLKFF